MKLASVSAAVLIGGRSRRMGEPKALLRLAPNSPTLVETVVAAVRELTSDVILVGRADWSVPESLDGLRRVVDNGNGAADGVIAALEAARFDACLVVGCDMPFLNVPLLREMTVLADRDERGALARDATGLHPLHAIWHRDDRERIKAQVAAGERSLAAIARDLGMATIDLDARDAAARWSVFNANTPDDLEIARARLVP